MNMNTMNTSTSMSASIQQAIFENNEGTRLVRHCEYDAAVTSFTVVSEILQPLTVIVEEKKQKQNACHSYDDDDEHDDDTTDCSCTTSAPLTISFTNKSMETRSCSCEDSNEMNDNKTTTTPSYCTSSSSAPASRTASPASTDHSTKQRKLKHFVFRDPVIIPTASISSATSASLSQFLMIILYNLA
mmetsp:Transcript_46134/g.49774  ORF Transcript_46134/g.49774 Transcript_46134/m.49774 type:complete len:187 (-) Transcript_46134:100-660(-)